MRWVTKNHQMIQHAKKQNRDWKNYNKQLAKREGGIKIRRGAVEAAAPPENF